MVHNSFRCKVIGSIYEAYAGPIPSTVFDPAFIWVCPASSTKYVLIPIYSASNFFIT